MTNEYKLAPIVPTAEVLSDGAYSQNSKAYTNPKGTYIAMLKDAPTVVEVDLGGMMKQNKNSSILQGSIEDAQNSFYRETYNQALIDLQQKHGKIYAVKEG